MLRRLALITLYALREHGGRTYSQRRIHRKGIQIYPPIGIQQFRSGWFRFSP